MTGSEDLGDGSLISAQELQGILDKPGLSVCLDTGAFQKLRDHLASLLSGLIRDAATKRPVTMKDMRAVERLHNRFYRLLESLQDTEAPPPMLDRGRTSTGEPLNDWDDWLVQIKFAHRGRPEQLNWSVINDLLAVHERLFGKTLNPKSPKQERDDAIRFLEDSFAVGKAHCEEKIAKVQPWAFMAPGDDALRKHLRKLYTGGLEFSRQRLEDILSH